MKPLISYYGGKQKISKYIIGMMPEHVRFVEPFAGGLAVFYAKQPSKIEVINDVDKYIVNLYRVAQSKKTQDDFYDMCISTPYSKSEHNRSTKIIKNNNGTDVEMAWAIWYNLNTSFASKKCGGWSMSKGKENFPNEFFNKKQLIKSQIDRLDNVYIDCRDAIDVIKYYDNNDTLFYCDPPYIETHQGPYAGYTIEMYKQLIKTLENINGQFILSGYNNEYVPKNWEYKTINTRCTARVNSVPSTEYLWYKIHNNRKLQMDLF